MKPQHDIENNLRKQRRMCDLTQQELADRAGVTRQTIFSIEKGKYTPSVALALRFAQIFDVSVEDLFQLKGGKSDV